MNSPVRFSLWPMPDLKDADAVHVNAGGTVRPDAYEEGYAAGFDAGRADAEAALEPVVRALREAADWFQASRAEVRAEVPATIARLATGIAGHIIRREVSVDEHLIVEAVRHMLEESELNDVVRVRLHPDDHKRTEAFRVLDEWPLRHEWIADASMERGSCVIEAPDRVIDGTIDSVLNDIAQRLAHA